MAVARCLGNTLAHRHRSDRVAFGRRAGCSRGLPGHFGGSLTMILIPVACVQEPRKGSAAVSPNRARATASDSSMLRLLAWRLLSIRAAGVLDDRIADLFVLLARVNNDGPGAHRENQKKFSFLFHAVDPQRYRRAVPERADG